MACLTHQLFDSEWVDAIRTPRVRPRCRRSIRGCFSAVDLQRAWLLLSDCRVGGGICGSDLHLLDGFIPTMKSGDVVGDGPIRIAVEVGSAVNDLRKGDRLEDTPS